MNGFPESIRERRRHCRFSWQHAGDTEMPRENEREDEGLSRCRQVFSVFGTTIDDDDGGNRPNKWQD